MVNLCLNKRKKSRQFDGFVSYYYQFHTLYFIQLTVVDNLANTFLRLIISDKGTLSLGVLVFPEAIMKVDGFVLFLRVESLFVKADRVCHV